MTKDKCRSVFLTLALISAITLSAAIFPMKEAEAQQAQISIVPSEVNIGNINDPVPADGIPFKVNITVSSATDLFAWQVRVYYFPRIINWTAADLPPGHVFDGKEIYPVDPSYMLRTEYLPQNLSNVNVANPIGSLWRWAQTRQLNLTKWIDTDTSGSLSESDLVWLQQAGQPEEYFVVTALQSARSTYSMTVEIAYIEYSTTLLGDVPGVNVTETKNLVRLSFKGLARGSSAMNFSRADTYLLDSSADIEIPSELSNSSVNVLALTAEQDPSTITIQANPSAVQIGHNVTISGTIDPAKANVDVTISIRSGAAGSWSQLAKVKTGSDSSYTYQWYTSSTGTFELKSSWQGDAQHAGDESEIITVSVTTEPPPEPFPLAEYLPYIAGVIVVVIVIVALVYFMKLRKR